MNRKAFFFDIDGTVLSEITGKIPDSTIKALEELNRQGHLTFVNSGRTFCSVPEEIKALPFSGFLCGCGTHVYYGGITLFYHGISRKRGEELIALMRECKAEPILEDVHDCYFPKKKTRFDRLESVRKGYAERNIGVSAFVEDEGVEYDKFVFYADEQTDKAKLMTDLEKDMDIIDREGEFYEIVPKCCSKATAIDFVLAYFHLLKEDAYVFGDSSNDLSMFRAVKHAIAMGHHDSVLDPYAEYVTKTVEEDGILHALKVYKIL